jgi:uncharacterized protein YecT (DUF1311 family)
MNTGLNFMKNWIVKILMFSALLFAFSDFTLAQSQLEMNQDACDKYNKSDAELNKAYQQILKEYKSDALFIRKLKNAQRAWVAYRDAHISSVYPAVNTQNEYGSVYPACRCIKLTEITQERTRELQQWIDRTEEGDVCSGSVKIRSYNSRLRQKSLLHNSRRKKVIRPK